MERFRDIDICFICDSWNSNELSSAKAFQLIGDSLKSLSPKDIEERDHLMELCEKIVDSLDKYKDLHN
jgi:hypothetical protein